MNKMKTQQKQEIKLTREEYFSLVEQALKTKYPEVTGDKTLQYDFDFCLSDPKHYVRFTFVS